MATRAKVRHHSCVGSVKDWFLQQSDHFGRNNAVQGRLQGGLMALRAYFHVTAHVRIVHGHAEPYQFPRKDSEVGIALPRDRTPGGLLRKAGPRQERKRRTKALSEARTSIHRLWQPLMNRHGEQVSCLPANVPRFFVTKSETERRQCRAVIFFPSPAFTACSPGNQFISFTAKHHSSRLIVFDVGSAFGKRGASTRACDSSRKNQPA